jgi:hypothetical protein
VLYRQWVQDLGAGKVGGEEGWVDFAMDKAGQEGGGPVLEYSPKMSITRAREEEEEEEGEEEEEEDQANNLSTLVDASEDGGMLGCQSVTSDVEGVRHADGAGALSWTGLSGSTAGLEQNKKPGAARFKERPVVKPQRPAQVISFFS